MDRNERIALIERAREAHDQVGRGMIVQLLEDAAPRFVPIEEAKARLVEERVDPGLLTAVLIAVAKYDTKWQAVHFVEREECCTVTILGHDRFDSSSTVPGRSCQLGIRKSLKCSGLPDRRSSRDSICSATAAAREACRSPAVGP